MTQQESPQVIGVRHVGLSARDPAALAEFYRDVLGLQVVPTDTAALGTTAVLSSHPAEVPADLVFFANSAYQHTAFEVCSLADLCDFYQRVLGRRVPVKMALNHGVSFSFYFEDPEGHVFEVYWPTGVACRPRHGNPVDLTRSEEELRRDVAELAAREAAPPAAVGVAPAGGDSSRQPLSGERGRTPNITESRPKLKTSRTARSRRIALVSSAAPWAAALLITAAIGGLCFLLATDLANAAISFAAVLGLTSAAGIAWRRSQARAERRLQTALDAYAEREIARSAQCRRKHRTSAVAAMALPGGSV